MDTRFDCAIIGGGPAGLNAALILDEQDERHIA
jgi:thioredoxin reductase